MQYERPAIEERVGLKGLITRGSYNDWYNDQPRHGGGFGGGRNGRRR